MKITMLAIAVAGLWSASADSRVGQTYCMPADAEASAFFYWVKSVATGTDSIAAADRISLGIPNTTESKVSIVTRESTCRDAGAAYSQVLDSVPPGGRSVYVVKVSAVYVVLDPAVRYGEWSQGMVFTSKWALIQRFVN